LKKCKILMPIGNLGIGILPEEMQYGMAMHPDVIAVDAGSTDSGPAYLATGTHKYQRQMLKHDLELCILPALEAHIPLLVGSCGTCGTDSVVHVFYELTCQILKEHGKKARVACIYSQQDAEVLKNKWDSGKIHALDGAPEISRETFDKCSNIVALCGAEPFMEALENKADIILCGRATDTAIIAAYPLMHGCDAASCWHGAKVVECGSVCTDSRSGYGVMLTVDDKGFAVTPLQPNTHCTPYTVAAHLLYENTNPFRLREPSGTIVTEHCVYTQLDEQSVYVSGTEFEYAEQYTLKLEGACFGGYQSICLVGMADPKITADPERWIQKVSAHVDPLIQRAGYAREDYSFNFKAYGYNAVIPGSVPEETPAPREIGMLLTITGRTQEMTRQIAKIFNPYLLHFPADEQSQMPSFAFPFSPVDCERGHTYEFLLHHVVDVDDPLELIRIEYSECI